MKRALVTGATGFVGRHALSPLLARGYEVHAVTSRGRPEGGLDGVTWHVADLLDGRGALELIDRVRPSHLLHFAWVTTPGAYWTSPENFRWVQASLELCRAFAEGGGRRVVMAGSCAEYDWRHGTCSEATTPLAPRAVYGACKNALREQLEAFARSRSLSWAWGRIFHVYGPHEHPDRLVASVVRSLLEGRRAPCSEGRQVRDYSFVQDVAGGFAALLDGAVEGAVNVASGRPLRIADLLSVIGAETGRDALIERGAVPARADEPDLLVADVTRLVREVGWSPAFDLRDGVREAIRWWSEAQARGDPTAKGG